MQPYFAAATCKRTIKSVIHEIELAKRRKAWIILIEFLGCGKSNKGIINKLKGYRKVYRYTKDIPDGSRGIVKAAKAKKFNLDTIKVCGVNTTACVSDTINGLTERQPNCKIKLVKKSV